MNLLTIESDRVRAVIAADIGGRVISFQNKATGFEHLWRNQSMPLRRESPGAEYDPNFFGGIDELIPNDIPETIAGVDCPDHGELWTLEMRVEVASKTRLSLSGFLPLFGFEIHKSQTLDGSVLQCKTKLTNRSKAARPFLWKLHAPIPINPGDRVYCDADTYSAADPDWSRRNGSGPWAGETIPEFDGSTEFLYLFPVREGRMGWTNGERRFEIQFDPKVFPYAWYFASYGGFNGHRVAILEPCTTMPISVNEANQAHQCPILEPGQSLETTYRYIAD